MAYSHKDVKYVDMFKKHITTLKNNGLIEEWYDRKVLPGKDYQKEIDNNFDEADIICLFISANFLNSINCMKEKEKALGLRRKKCVPVVPIILSHCGWLDYKEISRLKALPRDGRPIKSFSDQDKAWFNVYEGLKSVVEEEIKIRSLNITEKFKDFLQDTELLTKAHPGKESVFLNDIFVYPDLAKYDEVKEYERDINAQELIAEFSNTRLVIAGENQSGKTSLCKITFQELRKRNFVPVYICDRNGTLSGKIENRIARAFHEQYKQTDTCKIQFENIPKERIVPIIDDFHCAKKKEKHIRDLLQYCNVILTVDDIFALNVKDTNLVSSFSHFKIKEYKPSLRNEVIKKWLHLTNKQGEEDCYQQIDQKTETINMILGKVIGNGIMPSYPFFILSIISIQETYKPLQEITSQGYCYQAFIYVYLRKQGVPNDEIDTYVNFLTEFSYYVFVKQTRHISQDDFEIFMERYLQRYQLPVDRKKLLRNLQQTNLIVKDSFNNYSFGYEYIYYFFVAKYLAEHYNEEKTRISSVLNNLHKDENAYISIFISHHSKNNDILDEIVLNAMCLFDKFQVASLDRKEVEFFDKRSDQLVQAVLPPDITPEKERADRLRREDEIEIDKARKENSTSDVDNDDFSRELRRSIKTVEVMGRIIKNRAGSLERDRLEQIFEEAMKVHLRILTSFFEFIKQPTNEQVIVDFIKEKIEKILEEKSKKNKDKGYDKEKLRKLSKMIFWNMNFFTVLAIIQKVIYSLGSNKLVSITETVCRKMDTPVSFIIEKGIAMWYKKYLNVDEITSRIKNKDFSGIAENIIKFQIVNYCLLHRIKYKDIQRIEDKMGIPRRRLIHKYSQD